MPKKLVTPSKVKKITGASHHEPVRIPFYFAPPFLDELREWLKSHLSSSGGRPTIEKLDVVRKVRFSKESWRELESISKSWDLGGVSVSPSQVAASILEAVISEYMAKRLENESDE